MHFSKIHIVLFFVLSFSVALYSQNSYEMLFKTDRHENIVHVFYEDQDNFIIVLDSNAHNESNNGISGSIFYTCSIYDKDDTVRWPITLSSEDTSWYVASIIRDDNQNYILAGSGKYYYNNDSVISEFDWMMKLDTGKNVIWKKTYNRPAGFEHFLNSSGAHLLYTKQGNYLFAEKMIMYSPTFQRQNYFMLVNPNGDTIKTKVISPFLSGRIQALTYNFDSSTFLVHQSGQPITYCESGWSEGAYMLDTASFDTVGGVCYYKFMAGEIISPFDAKTTVNKDLIVAGKGFDYNLFSSKLFTVFKYDTNYNLVNRVNLTDPDTVINPGWAENLSISNNQEICLAGSFDNAIGMFTSHYCWVYLAKLDMNLNLISERYMGGDASYDVYSLTATDDGGIAVGGFRYDYLTNGPDEGDAFLFKTDAGLWVNTAENSSLQVHSVLVYPNPGVDGFKIRTALKGATFKLFDNYGRMVFVQKINGLITEINAESLPSGGYYWQMFQDDKIVDKGKWIKQ